MKRLAVLALSALTFLYSSNVSALTIDEFEDYGEAKIIAPAPNTTSTNIVSNSAIGGNRLLYIARTSSFNGGTTNIFSNTRLFHNQDSDVRAFSRVTWDKDSSSSNSIDPDGLGSVDMYQDGGSSFLLNISFDYGTSQPIDVTLRLFDSSDPSGNTYSEIAVTLNQVLSNFTLEIPFASLQSFGPKVLNGPGASTFNAFTYFPSGQFVNLSRVGAIVLEINGQNGDSDLSLGFIKTNGNCTGVPDAEGDVIDACGVCIGQPNYKAPKDDCGLCASDERYNKSKDSCGICYNQTGYGTSQDACGLCPSAPNYNNAKDPCGVCFGDGTTCADCTGTPNGGKTFDVCNVCNGNGTTCLDCSGTPFGTKTLDKCNVCGGDGSSCTKIEQCITVKATSDILAFEKRLISQAKTISKKYFEEDKRNKKVKCNINTKPSTTRVNNAYKTITDAGKEIFSKGVEICGDDCVTVSFADKVQALAPVLKVIEKETKTLANKVKQCYQRKRIKTSKNSAGVATTIKTLDSDLKQLIKDCKDKKICPK